MLILTRRTGETIMIGEEITITVLGVKGNQVRFGINAPKSVPVHREEIYKRIRAQINGTGESKEESTEDDDDRGNRLEEPCMKRQR